MLQPKKTKYRKAHKGRIRGKAKGGTTLNFGSYGLKALTAERVTSRQIEATRRSITRYVRKTGKIWIRVFPDKPVTERAAESRMGSGKGSTSYWVAVIKPGTVIFEINGLDKEMSYKVLKTASYKLPIKTKIIERETTRI